MTDISSALQNFILTFPIFLFALSFHEAAHAITAKWGGDLTSAYQGRITLNPVAHIDPIGTILIPAMAALFGNLPLIGWAKPVPVVEENYRRGSSYGVIVAAAGPFSNFLLACMGTIAWQIYFIIMEILSKNGINVSQDIQIVFLNIFQHFLIINLALMTFNLIPIPPLDGSHLLWHWFVKDRPKFREIFFGIRPYSYMILLGLIYFGAFDVLVVLVIYPLFSIFRYLAHLPLSLL